MENEVSPDRPPSSTNRVSVNSAAPHEVSLPSAPLLLSASDQQSDAAHPRVRPVASHRVSPPVLRA